MAGLLYTPYLKSVETRNEHRTYLAYLLGATEEIQNWDEWIFISRSVDCIHNNAPNKNMGWRKSFKEECDVDVAAPRVIHEMLFLVTKEHSFDATVMCSHILWFIHISIYLFLMNRYRQLLNGRVIINRR